ncbi:hypothetical protein O5Y_28945 [Rhodococcus erythropolis CCM2595]|uniref:DUF6301 family protein n=1 Tax=Rhodococcus erythropolis TaxID=1833 RepID=UPI00038DC426|nr:DUF6301 family protein [Rhodococcus erythropolis]AGT95606.1 hypothetical protein O5Y_28945 [Rhodococcus erythropolis CCM2595]SUE10017.1 Uncharacterised protein [Rhodococcus erythropolis]
MHVDIEGATRIARLAAEFDWTWAVDDLEPFCAQAGWELVELRQGGASIRTNLHVCRPKAMTVVRPLLDEGFANLTAALTSVLPIPTYSEPGPEATIRWDLPKVVVELSMRPRAIHLQLTSPKYQAWVDEPEPEDED